MRTDEGDVLPGEWADGFYGAIKLTLDAWRPLFERKDTGEPIMAILLHATRPELLEMLGEAYPKPARSELKDSWRALPFAVEAIYAVCEPSRLHPGGPSTAANEA
jgi:uncharacterized protein